MLSTYLALLLTYEGPPDSRQPPAGTAAAAVAAAASVGVHVASICGDTIFFKKKMKMKKKMKNKGFLKETHRQMWAFVRMVLPQQGGLYTRAIRTHASASVSLVSA